MPLDATVIQPYGQVTKTRFEVPGGPVQLATLDPARLKTLMNKETPKKFNDKSKIVFIDCQSKGENTGKQMVGAIHMDMNAATLGPAKFNAVIRNAPLVYNKLGAAELVVFYCFYGASRSPTIMTLYNRAVANPATQPATYNANQIVLLLDGGINAYQQLGNLPNITDYVGMQNGKIVAKGSGGQVTQPDGDWGVIYTDP